MTAAFDTFQYLQRPIGPDLEFVHALKLVRNAQALADHLHRHARPARGGFPAAEDEQALEHDHAVAGLELQRPREVCACARAPV